MGTKIVARGVHVVVVVRVGYSSGLDWACELLGGELGSKAQAFIRGSIAFCRERVRVEVVGGGVVHGAGSNLLSYGKVLNTKIGSRGRLADITNIVGDTGRSWVPPTDRRCRSHS